MKLLDVRRLRGRGLDSDLPAAIAEVALAPSEDPERALAIWRRSLVALTTALARPDLASAVVTRIWPGGLSLLLPTALDELLPATDVLEWTVENAARELAGKRTLGVRTAAREIGRAFRRASRPNLPALARAARERGVPFLWDDELVTLGHAARARSFPMRELPAPEAVEWSALGRIPVALVTGTNGKTTTTRLTARMVKLAGRVPGHTSSDGVAIDEEIIEAGDWTGPEAARLVLRSPRVEVAILESARGGILRRGLAVDQVDAAVLTNVAADHLGEHGVTDRETMVRVKAVCARAVRPGGRVVLPGADPSLHSLAPGLDRPIVWTAREPSPFIADVLAKGGEAVVAEDGVFVHRSPEGRDALLPIVDAPLTFGGTALYNVDNLLSASALALSLGLPRAAIVEAMRTFGAAATDNPGRGTLVPLGAGVRGLFDFGHNAAGFAELYPLARSLAAGRTLVHVLTLAGDRNDEELAAVARTVARGAGKVVLWETEKLLRGRAPGETTAILRRELVRAGLDDAAILVAPNEAEGIRTGRALAREGDLVLVAPSIDRTLVPALSARGS